MRYEQLLRAEKLKYEKLESYNRRLYAAYAGMHNKLYLEELRKTTGAQERTKLADRIPPFHPLK